MSQNILIESISGVRGIYGQGITENLAERYVFCYCQMFKNKLRAVAVGGDSRISTLALKKVITEAFKKCGIGKIIDVGILPIQAMEYAVLKFKANGGFYITASHNEPEYNGWKILKSDGALLYAQQMNELKKKVYDLPEKIDFPEKKNKTLICKKQSEAISVYCDYIFERIGKIGLAAIKKSNLKILLDPNGGSSIVIWKKLLPKLRINAKIINDKLGNFNHLVEPNVESLAYLNRDIEENNFAFAAGFDCDADRVELVVNRKTDFAKEMGCVVNGNYVLALACDAVLPEVREGQTIVTNDVTAYLIRDVVKKYKAKIIEVEVGEMMVVREMERQKSLIGGEGSNGGVIIPPIKCRDGIMATLLILKLLALKRKSLSDILQEYPKYYSERAVMKYSGELTAMIKKKLEDYFRRNGWKVKKTGDKTGGLKAHLDKNSYIWFRQSKTEAGSFRIIADGDNRKKVKNLLKEGKKAFWKCKI